MSTIHFDGYLKDQYSDKNETFTHTRIGDKESKIHGGLYTISSSDKATFQDLYYKHVFVDGNKEYLTEKQRVENAPFVIDVDMRYGCDIKTRQHTKNHIIDLIDIYANNISKIFTIPVDAKMEVFVMEKPGVNVLDTKTKDGIHIIFGLATHKATQVLIREKVLPELKIVWEDLPLTNDIDELIDEGITRGTVNWQMYGSRKPHHDAYAIKYHFELRWQAEENEWTMAEFNLANFNIKRNIHKLSVHCTDFPNLEIKSAYTEVIEKMKENLGKKKKTMKLIPTTGSSTFAQQMNFDSIKSTASLDEAVAEMLASFEGNANDYELKETHGFTLTLPKNYYEPGSYNKWIRVGWALRNTSDRLLITWLKFCSQSSEFYIGEIPELITLWKTFDTNLVKGLTAKSIMYWVKTDNLAGYNVVRESTVSYYMELTYLNQTEFDFAQVLYHMCKGDFVCVSVKNNTWYEYKHHKWYEIDSGNTLRMIISKRMYEVYLKKASDLTAKLLHASDADDVKEKMRKLAVKVSDIAVLLKKTCWKNNIMREAKELFYDKDFYNKLDNNAYLLCFNNYVIDFRAKTHRPGQPDDYISKSTNIDYIPLDKNTDKKSEAEIEEFMAQLFPNEELRKYMWEHLASTLIGNNDNQTFNIYTGSGRNGKSKLVDLMSKLLGDYKATIPITLLTQKRNNIGSTSSEIVQLMGVRYAVMQEPCKGETINEGIMKEITGGDPIQGRALFRESVTFVPQFKLVVCTNTLFDIKSNDDGTWRRIRICDFISKFLENPYGDEDKFPKEDYPYQYDVDKKIDEKFARWAPVLAGMLVELTYKLQGVVKDSKVVMGSSDQYREGQDYLTEFCKDKVKKMQGGRIRKLEIYEIFKQWYITNCGRGGAVPKPKELYEHMEKRYGKMKFGKWSNVAMIYDEEEEGEEEDL